MKSQELAKQEAEKRARLDELFKKGDAANEAELKEADLLVADVERIIGERKAAESREAFATQNERELKALRENPVNPMPQGQAEVVDWKRDGITVIEKGDLSVVYEEGFSLDQKTFERINSKGYKQAFRNYLRKGIHGLDVGELKDIREGSDRDGGFLVPADVLNQIISRKPTPTRLNGMVQRFQTSSNRLEIPKNTYGADDKYTTGIRVSFVDEITNASAHRAADPQWGSVEIPIHTAMLSLALTKDMIEDAAFPIVSWTTGKFQETVDLLYDDKIVNGTGQKQPAGILLNPGGANQPAVIPMGDANLIKPDGLFDIAYSMPEQYDENAKWVFNKTNTARAISKLKDNNNRYLFATGQNDDAIATARPKQLIGYDYVYSGFMPDTAANSFPIIFGDLRGYYLVNRVGFSIQVLNEIEAQSNRVILLGRLRFGGQVAEDWRMKIGKISVS